MLRKLNRAEQILLKCIMITHLCVVFVLAVEELCRVVLTAIK